METSIIIAGFGGQGVLFAGQILAYAAMESGMEVTWFPSYGPEMRGGTANCTVILSDEEIGSPAVRNPKAVVAMNLPSLDKYEELVQADGGQIVPDRQPLPDDEVDGQLRPRFLLPVHVEADPVPPGVPLDPGDLHLSP